MFLYAIVLSLIASLLITTTLSDISKTPDTELRATAEIANMRTYKQAASAFIEANPAFTGVVPNASVTPFLPTSFVNTVNWSTIVVAGTPRASYTWGFTTLSGGAYELYEQAKASRLVGYKAPAGNDMFSPVYGQLPGIVLPTAITPTALVIVGYH